MEGRTQDVSHRGRCKEQKHWEETHAWCNSSSMYMATIPDKGNPAHLQYKKVNMTITWFTNCYKCLFPTDGTELPMF